MYESDPQWSGRPGRPLRRRRPEPFDGGEWSGRGGFGRGRARRGEIRSSILILLAERPMHGYELIGELAERTGGNWRPSPGSIYPTLSLLEDEGLIAANRCEGKKAYQLTEAGRSESVRLAETGSEAPWTRMTESCDPAAHELHQGLKSLSEAVKQVARTGSEEQKAAARELLTQTRRSVYLLLAE